MNNRGNGEEEFKGQLDRSESNNTPAAAKNDANGDDSDSSFDSDEDGQESDLKLNFLAQHINLLFYTLALIVENDYLCA